LRPLFRLARSCRMRLPAASRRAMPLTSINHPFVAQTFLQKTAASLQQSGYIEPVMKPMSRTAVRPGQFAQAALACGLLLIAFAVRPAIAAGCAFEPQGEGRVVSVVDARTFRLEDGREVRLAG